MLLANLSHAERLDHDALLYSLSKVTTQKWLIYLQEREKSEKCSIILLERERERRRKKKRRMLKSFSSHPEHKSERLKLVKKYSKIWLEVCLICFLNLQVLKFQ